MSETPFAIHNLQPELAPTIFADGILNVAVGNGIVKFYAIRSDPTAAGTESEVHIVAQIVMPLEAFVGAAVFFEERLKFFQDSSVVSGETVAKMRAEQGIPR